MLQCFLLFVSKNIFPLFFLFLSLSSLSLSPFQCVIKVRKFQLLHRSEKQFIIAVMLAKRKYFCAFMFAFVLRFPCVCKQIHERKLRVFFLFLVLVKLHCEAQNPFECSNRLIDFCSTFIRWENKFFLFFFYSRSAKQHCQLSIAH